MERIYSLIEKRTKHAVSRVVLAAQGWGINEKDAFENCKQSLAIQVMLAHHDLTQRLCVYTDASDLSLSGIATQIPIHHVLSLHKEQKRPLLALLMGRFDTTQLGWLTLEKEVFAITNTLDCMRWIVCTPDDFDLYTDYNNLIFFQSPRCCSRSLIDFLRKLLRWAFKLIIYLYTCNHIKGDDNVWGGLLTRWSSPPAMTCHIENIPELSSSFVPDFEWPTQAKLVEAQEQYVLNF